MTKFCLADKVFCKHLHLVISQLLDKIFQPFKEQNWCPSLGAPNFWANSECFAQLLRIRSKTPNFGVTKNSGTEPISESKIVLGVLRFTENKDDISFAQLKQDGGQHAGEVKAVLLLVHQPPVAVYLFQIQMFCLRFSLASSSSHSCSETSWYLDISGPF